MVKKLTISALEPFLAKPHEKMHLSDISRSIGEPHPTVRLWLSQLEKEGITRKELKGRMALHSLNLESPLIVDYIVMAEKHKLIRNCGKWPVLGEMVSFMQRNPGGNALIFGSAAADFDAANDIDMLIVGRGYEKLEDFTQRLGKESHIVHVKSLIKITKTLKAEIIKKHLLVKGSEDFVRWMIWQQ
ncbi:hypothetical protein J4212_03690 [Candidatus Woesearchaeota archaeon]|nr:hypothetical protein [Candidatus Woesearchaeota archaeon]